MNKNNEEIVEFLVEKDANVNFPNLKGDTPLHYAIMKSNLAIVDLLAKKS